MLQLQGERGSITTSAIVAVYVAYLTFCAVSLNPNEECNATASNGSKLLALLIGLFVVRPLVNRMFGPQAAGSATMLFAQPIAGQLPAPADGQAAHAQAALPPPKESMIDLQRIEGQVRDSSVKKVGEVVNSHPEEALAIIRTWLHEPA